MIESEEYFNKSLFIEGKTDYVSIEIIIEKIDVFEDLLFIIQSFFFDCNLNIIARAYIGGEYPKKDLPYEPLNKKNNCNYTDLCTDGYAILLASYLKKQNGKLDPAFRETFIDNKGRQFAAVLSDIGAKKDVSEIKNKVTSVVNKVLVKWLTIFENEFTDSHEEVKEACIETFSKWLYLSI